MSTAGRIFIPTSEELPPFPDVAPLLTLLPPFSDVVPLVVLLPA